MEQDRRVMRKLALFLMEEGDLVFSSSKDKCREKPFSHQPHTGQALSKVYTFVTSYHMPHVSPGCQALLRDSS